MENEKRSIWWDNKENRKLRRDRYENIWELWSTFKWEQSCSIRLYPLSIIKIYWEIWFIKSEPGQYN
jgi:hypothetical protein